jgi:hypothetical protein
MYLFARSRIRYLHSNTTSHINSIRNYQSYPIRASYATSSTRLTAHDLSQGHATDPRNLHPQDVQSEAVRKGKEARKDEKNEAIDAANEAAKTGDGKKPMKKGRGNPEGIGFVEQVGGASGSVRKFEELEEERK